MLKQKVVIIHSSAIIQKGLAELLLNNCNLSVWQFISDYPTEKHAIRFKKTVLFISHELINRGLNQIADLKRNGNSVYVIVGGSDRAFPEIPFENLLYVNDTLAEIQKKLSLIFPAAAKNTAKPGGLTERETEVLKLVALGNSNKEIGDHLSISLHTVISHRKNICRKLEIKTIAGLTLYAHINNLIS